MLKLTMLRCVAAILGLCSSATVHRTWAETPPARASKKDIPHTLTPEITAAIGKRLDIDPDSVDMKRLLGMVQTPSAWSESMNVVMRLHGKNGVSFPSKDEKPAGVLNVESFIPEIREAYDSNVARIIKKFEPKGDEFPVCPQSITAKEPLATDARLDPKLADKPVFDMVFIAQKDVPPMFDSVEVLGPNIMVRLVDTSHPEAVAMALETTGVKCLPYRIRVTRRFKMRDQGLNALMNYADRPYGRGKLHPVFAFMKERYK